MWLGLALVSCLLWAVVFVLDSHLVDEVFDRPWVGVVVSAAFSAAALPVAVAWALTGGPQVSVGTVAVGLGAGAAFALCQLAHFQALRYTEAGIVAAYWSMTPVFVLAGGFLFLGERLSGGQYAGVAVLTAASAVFGAVDTNREARWRAFWVMAAGCLFQAAYFLAQKVVFDAGSVRQGFAPILAGTAAVGLAPLLLPGGRRVLRGNAPRLRGALRLLLGIEAVHLLAVFTGQLAVDAGTATLAAAVESAIPGATFLLSVALFAAFGRYGEEEARRRLPAKLLLVAIMALGVWLLA